MFDHGEQFLVHYSPNERLITSADSQNKALDFRNPENFYHDVNSVTGLLKLFFRDLPDPLLTAEHHDSFIAASSKFNQSRSSIFGAIND
jgi:hypothetical protein